MDNIKIVTDSSSNVVSSEVTDFAFAPMKIITKETEFTDDINLDVNNMVEFFEGYKEKSQTSCPNSTDWLEAFGSSNKIICITITSALSGSYNSACAAKDIYEAENAGRKVCVIDSLSAGPELLLLVEKAEELIAAGMSFDDICLSLQSYTKETALLFVLESLNNFAANGRVSPAVAKIAGFLGIRVVGKASDKGELEPLNKCRGEARSLEALFSHLKEMGHSKGKVRIAHCKNKELAQQLKDIILSQNSGIDVYISECRGLCSYYAEKGGMLVAFERF